MGSVPAAPCEDILACPGSCGNIWKESLPCVADSLRLSHSGHFAHLALVSDDRSARDRETLKALSLLYTAHWYPRIFTLVRANSPNSRHVLPFFIVNCISDSSAIPRHNRSISILSRHIFCPSMTGHQLPSSLYYLCSEAVALSRLVLTGLCICASASKDRWEGRDGDAADSTNTNRVVCIYPQQQQQLQRDSPETVWCKLKSTRLQWLKQMWCFNGVILLMMAAFSFSPPFPERSLFFWAVKGEGKTENSWWCEVWKKWNDVITISQCGFFMSDLKLPTFLRSTVGEM